VECQEILELMSELKLAGKHALRRFAGVRFGSITAPYSPQAALPRSTNFRRWHANDRPVIQASRTDAEKKTFESDFRMLTLLSRPARSRDSP
jgi:hypothetical protein